MSELDLPAVVELPVQSPQIAGSPTLRIVQELGGSLSVTLNWQGMPLGTDTDRVELQRVDGGILDADWLAVSKHSFQHGASNMAARAELLVPSIKVGRHPDPADGELTLTLHVAGAAFYAQAPVIASAGGRPWEFEMSEPVDAAKARLQQGGRAAINATLAASLAPGDSVSDAISVAEDLLWLLRFGSARPYQWCRATVRRKSDGQLVWREFRDGPHTQAGSPGPLPFDSPYFTGMGAFLERALPLLRSTSGTHRTRAVIHMLMLARRTGPVELRGMVASGVLEVLRHNFGMNVLVPSGRAVLSGHDICWPPGQAPSGKDGRRMWLKEIIAELCSDLSLSGWDDAFKDLRNQVMHQGEIPGATARERHYNVMDLVHFLDRVLLSLFDADKEGLNYNACNSRDPHSFIQKFAR